MKSGTKKRESIFHELNIQLLKWEPDIGENIHCPLCWQMFNIKSLDSLLSIEHIPPSSVVKLINEDYYTTLTCKRCNHTFGSKYHSQLKKFLIFQLNQVGKYDRPIKGKISYPNSSNPMKSNIIFKTQDKKVDIVGVRKANAPLVIQDYVNGWKDIYVRKKTDWSYTVTLNYECVPSVVWSAYIQVAYLFVYVLTGCHYAFTKAGKTIREKLVCGDISKMGPAVINPSVVGIGGKPWVARVENPVNLRCFLVKIAGNIVILPFPNDEQLSCYSEWQKVSKQIYFGLSPDNVLLDFSFFSAEDVIEAKKCIKLTEKTII
jgi:hypothetical protein